MRKFKENPDQLGPVPALLKPGPTRTAHNTQPNRTEPRPRKNSKPGTRTNKDRENFTNLGPDQDQQNSENLGPIWTDQFVDPVVSVYSKIYHHRFFGTEWQTRMNLNFVKVTHSEDS